MKLENTSFDSRLKLAELTSSIGAGVLGLGLGVHFGEHLKSFSLPIIAIGIFSHAVGMFDKHRLESQVNGVTAFWTKFLYWICWVSMAGLIAYFIYLQRGGL
ncbi:MAG: hypothetical protein AB7H48_05495 [Parachlamydiales bacterium]